MHLTWVVLLPVFILSGFADSWLSADPGVVTRFIGDSELLIAMHAPPDASVVVGTRFLTVFPLMESMHYVTWIVLMPWLSREVTERVEHRVPAIRGWRLWGVGIAAAALLGVVFVLDWFEGRAIYSMLASYHAYLEYLVLLALLLGASAGHGPSTRAPSSDPQPAVT